VIHKATKYKPLDTTWRNKVEPMAAERSDRASGVRPKESDAGWNPAESPDQL
jgi:hypothetical protein